MFFAFWQGGPLVAAVVVAAAVIVAATAIVAAAAIVAATAVVAATVIVAATTTTATIAIAAPTIAAASEQQDNDKYPPTTIISVHKLYLLNLDFRIYYDFPPFLVTTFFQIILWLSPFCILGRAASQEKRVSG